MTCSKIFSGDLPELTTQIIQHFRNDVSTLYACILINRLWCRLTIPLLWEDPFSNNTGNHNFITTYLRNLTEDDKTKLNDKYGIDKELFPSNTLFNYPSFIKYLNIQNFSWSIEKWAENFKNLTEGQKHILTSQDINSNLFKIFIEKEVNLHTFEIMINDKCHDYCDIVFELVQQFPYFISNIRNFKLWFHIEIINLENFYPFLKFLYSNCNTISSLSLELYFYNFFEFNFDTTLLSEEYLPQLIISQKNLQKISFEGYTKFSLYRSLLSLKNSNCTNTLNIIIFYHIDFKNITIFNEVFEQLNVLESIHVIYCSSLDFNFVEQIINISKPFKLKTLFINEKLQIDSISLLLQKSGNYLENFGSEYNSKLIELIMKYCTIIKYCYIFKFDNNHDNFITAFNLIKIIEQSINYISIESENIEFSSIVLQKLGQILPFKLVYLDLYLTFKMKDFEIFLKNSHNTFIKKLSIRNVMQGEDILPYIKEYIMKKKRVKYLSVEVNNKELLSLRDEVEEFKLYDIEVRHYYELAIYIDDFIGIYD
jgi:hypothetical protein